MRGALECAFEGGLGNLSFGRVGAHLGISDRMVVYYLATKAELITAVVTRIGLDLQAALDAAIESSRVAEADHGFADHHALLRQVWPVLARAEHDAAFGLFFEASGHAAAGQEPYAQLVPALVEAWIGWAASHLGGDPDSRRAEAEATIALADGLLLFRQLAGPDAADRAARQLGII